MRSRSRMRITEMSLCRYIKETRRTSYASRIPTQASKGISIPAARYDWAVRACGHPVGTINSLSYRASERRQKRRRGPNVKVVLCLIYATEPGTGRIKIGPRRDRRVRVNRRERERERERAATATRTRAKTLNPDDDGVARTRVCVRAR